MNETICWSCKNATGNCSWSKNFIPVKGWSAEQTYLKDEQLISYKVNRCPLYKLDRLQLSNELIAKMLKISHRQFYRLSKIEILNRLKQRHYNVILISNDIFVLVGN